MPIQQVLSGQRVPIKIWTDDIDDRAKAQLANIATLPFIHHHVAAMPDVLLGKGASVGSVIATYQAIIPAAVGVDIGCGMVAMVRFAARCRAYSFRLIPPKTPDT